MQTSLTRTAIRATLHCLTGCAVGEIIGSVIGSGLNWSNFATEALTIPLAFASGYGLTMFGLRGHLPLPQMVRLALASDTISIFTMELVDTLIMVLVPGALAAGPATFLFWWSLALALAVAFVAAVPVNRYLLSRGRGHAVMHNLHSHS
jgi:hypothetical protein